MPYVVKLFIFGVEENKTAVISTLLSGCSVCAGIPSNEVHARTFVVRDIFYLPLLFLFVCLEARLISDQEVEKCCE